MPYLCTRNSETKRIPNWCGSSAWLEYMPVTHGVASSSLVRTASCALPKRAQLFFIKIPT